MADILVVHARHGAGPLWERRGEPVFAEYIANVIHKINVKI